MAFVTRSLEFINGLDRPSPALQKVLISLFMVAIGAVLGALLTSSREVVLLTFSVLVFLVILPLIVGRPLNGLLLLLFFTPFIEQWVEIPMGAGLPDLSFSRLVVAFVTIFMLARAATGKFRFAGPLSFTEVCIIATTLGIMLSAFISENPNQVIQQTITRHFVPLYTFFLARHLVRSKADLHRVFWTISLFGAVAAIYAVYETFTGHILFYAKELNVTELRTELTEDLYLLRGLLGLAANFGRVFLVSIPLSFYLFFEDKRLNRRALLMLLLMVQFYGMFLTYNRTSWYTLMIGLFVMQLVYPQFRKLYLVLVFVAAIVLFATWNQVNDSAASDRLTERTEDYNGRSPRWEAAFNMWQARPVTGWGYGRFEHESGRFRTDGLRENFRAIENDFLVIMVGSGLIGFLPYVLFLLAPLVNSIRLFFRVRTPDWPGFIKRETIAVYWVVLLCFLIGSYSQIQNEAIVKMLPFAVAGAVIGAHQHLLNASPLKKTIAGAQPSTVPANAPAE
jgi:O-antigen ligase